MADNSILLADYRDVSETEPRRSVSFSGLSPYPVELGTGKKPELRRWESMFENTTLFSGSAFLLANIGVSRSGSFSSIAEEDETGGKNLRASVLVLGSALVASLMSLDIKQFNDWTDGDGMFTAMCTAAIGATFAFSALAAKKSLEANDTRPESDSDGGGASDNSGDEEGDGGDEGGGGGGRGGGGGDIVKEKERALRFDQGGLPVKLVPACCGLVHDSRKLPWFFLRACLGGCSAVLAFGALAHLDLAVANTIMFTMPLWTAMLAYVCVGRPWGTADVVVAVTSLVGVALVSLLWRSDGLAATEKGMTGLGCALGFAITNAVAAVVVNTRLRGESPLAMTAFSMLAGLFLSSAIFIFNFNYQALKDKPHERYFLDSHPWYQWSCLTLLGLFMVGQQSMRNAGMALASDSSVTVILYFEVVFSFVWDVLILYQQPRIEQYVGAGVIIIGAIGATLLRVRMQRRADKEATAEKAEKKRVRNER